jgi:hypothetical protein
MLKLTESQQRNLLDLLIMNVRYIKDVDGRMQIKLRVK